AVAVALCVSVPAAGQWLNYPTAGVPRLPDGKPNLAAPPPRTADGKPDLSGLWAIRREGVTAERGPINISPGMRNDARVVGGHFRYQPWARAVTQQHRADNWRDAPSSRCLPLGPL